MATAIQDEGARHDYPTRNLRAVPTTSRTLQIATFGNDPEKVLPGVKTFPIHKLALICQDEHLGEAQEFSTKLKVVLGIPVEIFLVGKPVLEKVQEVFAKILSEAREKYRDYIVNSAGGDSLLGCAALLGAFVNGLKVFVLEDQDPVMLPMIKLSYSELLSDAKKDILNAIYSEGGEVDSLQRLSGLCDYGKALLSYHINGTEHTKGLEELGLINVERIRRGRTRIKLTIVGKMLLNGSHLRS